MNVCYGSLRVPRSLCQEIMIEAEKQDRFIYEIVADAWELYKATQKPDTEQSTPQPQPPPLS